MFRSIAASWTLFFGLLLIMAGNGLQVVLLGTRASEAAFSNIATGFVMAGYYVGIFFGSILVPRILANVGHVRVFGAMSAIASSAILIHAAFVDPVLWAVMRLLTGFSFAGMYIVCESWLNDKATNETRGQLLSIYMIINMGGMSLGQVMISFGEDGGYGLFLLASVMVSMAVVPILITVGKAPEFDTPERLGFRRLYQISPLAVMGMALTGAATAMIFGMGPIYGRSIGMTNTEVGYFMAAVTLGTLILQYPVGRLSDRFDRRIVILGVAIVSGLSVLVATLFNADELAWLLICMLIFGGTNFPLYSLCIAHANDYLTPRQMVAMASGLIMINGAGAVIGAPIAAMFIEYLGTISFMPTIAASQFLLALFALVRMRSRSAVPAAAQGPYVAIPDSSSGVAASLNPEAEWVSSDEDGFTDDDPLKDNPYIN